MRLSKLYSNKPAVFLPITFNEGLSVVLAEIRLPENRDKDTHNLGKSTLVQLIDFCFLRSTRPEFFLVKHRARFEGFVFYLELELSPGEYLTIQRGVEVQVR